MIKTARQILFSSLLVLEATGFAWSAEPVEQSGALRDTLGGRTVLQIRGSRNLNGAISIIAQPSDVINVTFRKWARASSESQARRFLDLIDLKLQQLGEDREILSILTPSDAPWQGSDYGVRVEIFIEIPERMRIEGDVQFMEMNVRGPFQGTTLRSQYAPVQIETIVGPVDVSASFAGVKLTGIKGNIRAETKYGAIDASDITVPLGSAIFQSASGSITLDNVHGPVEAYTSYSEIRVRNIDAGEGSVVLRTSYSAIDVSNVKGELICETTFSAINVSEATLTHGHSKIETSYSPIRAEFARISNCQLFVNNHYSNIMILMPANTSSQLVASVDEGGKIRTSNLPLKPTSLGATRLEGVLDDGLGRIELSISGIGEISIKGR